MLTLVEPVEFFPADALEQETQKPTAIRARLALAGLGAKTGRAMGGLSGPCSLAKVGAGTATSFAGMRLHPQLSKHAWQKYKCKFCTPATFRRTNVIELPNGIRLKLGEADLALKELEALPTKIWKCGWAIKTRIAAIGVLRERDELTVWA